MSSEIRNYRVPSDKMAQFHEIICDTGSRHINNPINVGDSYIVNCELQIGFWARWNQCTIAIKEKPQAAFWKNSLRRVIGRMKAVSAA